MNCQILEGDCRDVLATLPEKSVQCVVTSPPYFGLRDYGVDGQIGLEPTPDEFVQALVSVFREVRRVLRDDGTVWINLGDTYANQGFRGSAETNGGFTGARMRAGAKGIMDSRPREIPPGLKPKDLIGIPWRVAFALQSDGWYLRSDIIWHKPNPMPESVTDRPTKSHEYVFLLAKSERYYYDHEAIAEPTLESSLARSEAGFVTSQRDTDTAAVSIGGNVRTRYGLRESFVAKPTRNRRSVWTVATQPYPEAHFATYPPELIRPCVLAGSPEGGTVLDPFNGAGTTGLVALQHGRDYIGIELNPEYARLTRERLAPLLAQPNLFSKEAAA